MKSLLLVILSLFEFFFVQLQAQDLSTIISKDGIQTQSIQSFSLSDSLIVLFSTAGKRDFIAVVVGPDGAQTTLELDELKGKTIAGISSSQGKIHFDFFLESKDIASISRLSLETAKMTKSFKPAIELSGRIIGYEATDSLTILTYDSKSSTIHLSMFKDLQLVFENQFPFNAKIFKEKLTFIPRQNFVRASDADGDIKIQLTNKFLWILAENHENKSMGTSSVFKIDIKTGKMANKAIFEFSGEKWNTMLCGQHIIKVSRSQGISLTAYSFESTEPIYSTTFKENSAVSQEIAYERRGAGNEVYRVNVQQALKAWGRPFVIPMEVNANSTLLKIGNYEPATLPKASGLSYASTIFDLMRIPSYLFNSKVSADRYFYLRGNVTNGFHYEAKPDVIDRAIDEYELSDRDNPQHITFKGYVASSQGSFALYKFEKHYDQLKVCFFKTAEPGP